jgi:hypothetical protein
MLHSPPTDSCSETQFIDCRGLGLANPVEQDLGDDLEGGVYDFGFQKGTASSSDRRQMTDDG